MKPAAAMLAALLLAAGTPAYRAETPAATPAKAAAIAWQPHFEAALDESKVSGKDIFIFITGSDWCKPGVRFKTQVLDSTAFRQAAGNRFTFAVIDHPDVMTDARREAEKKNAKFTLWTNCYPAVALADPSGRVYGRIACAKETKPAAFLQKVARLQAVKAARDTEWELAEKSQGVERATHFGKGLDALDEDLARQKEYQPIREKIKKADPEDKSGYTARYAFNLNSIMEGQVWRLAGEKKFEEAETDLDRQLTNRCLTVTQRQGLTAAKFALYQRWERKEDALAQLKKIIELAPASDMAAGAKGYLDFLQSAPVPVTDRWDGSICGERAVWLINVTGTLSQPGTYKLCFTQKAGGDKLTISEAVLLCGDTELAADRHEGRADNSSGSYLLEVKEVPAGGKLTIRVTSRCGGWHNSSGEITISKVAFE